VRDRASFSLQDFRYRAALNQRILDFELMGTAVQRSYSLERMAPKADGEAAFRDHWFSLSNPRGH